MEFLALRQSSFHYSYFYFLVLQFSFFLLEFFFISKEFNLEYLFGSCYKKNSFWASFPTPTTPSKKPTSTPKLPKSDSFIPALAPLIPKEPSASFMALDSIPPDSISSLTTMPKTISKFCLWILGGLGILEEQGHQPLFGILKMTSSTCSKQPGKIYLCSFTGIV